MRFRRLPLRSRLALLTAMAVAVAVAVSAFASWLIVREQLSAQLDSSLRNVTVDERNVLSILEACQSPDGADDRTPHALGSYSVQIVLADGSRCTQPGATKLPVTTADVAVAVGERPSALHDATGAGGEDMRVFTYRPASGPGSPLPRGIAVSMARPLSEVAHPLGTLALVLALVAGVGVVGAGAAGLWIARTGLKPVDRLTEAVEHVARTEDLAVRIPTEGDDEIARLSRSFNSMTAALASSRDRQQQLIADAGHELRTPLTSLRTNIELLARSEETGRALPPADRKALMGSVKAQMTELAALIGDLQELSRPDALPGSGPPQVVALHEVVRTALERARLRGAHLTINASIEPWYVRGEATALERALVNLLDNAVKFSPSGGVIDVVLRSGEVRVRDHGPGIPAEELPHVFERFWRSPSARSMPGSGLGLSIVARTVQQSGGQVGLEPAPGGGTAAWLRLPGAPVAPPGTEVD
ncbi:HAMP domain-containing sensor histidine kinase [Streptomyces iranensis]|uniref:histidine kinase n=1 Tax=Streptomyces iranensis TaxID=576784 RepID=A0A060ZXR0_9ACTN|nr:HAMP domain-containing sensor histidine kinase [Streptomyces iranensis]MBP2067993.1 two-component system sensor histidine kinase MprB [Streptomyces iranensis]CDR07949.1 integral membrane sensor signal transductionhistidine kinase [Streptomyces iranensis]